jgi:hypothetical protein
LVTRRRMVTRGQSCSHFLAAGGSTPFCAQASVAGLQTTCGPRSCTRPQSSWDTCSTLTYHPTFGCLVVGFPSHNPWVSHATTLGCHPPLPTRQGANVPTLCHSANMPTVSASVMLPPTLIKTGFGQRPDRVWSRD